MGKLTLAPQKARKKGSPAANLLAGEAILRGGNCSEQTANMCVCCFGRIPRGERVKADG